MSRLVVIGLLALTPSIARAQMACAPSGTAALDQSFAQASSRVDYGRSLNELRAAIGTEIRRRMEGDHIAGAWIADLRSRKPIDVSEMNIAFAAAFLMQGAGVGVHDVESDLAGDLYRAWPLPPEPAAMLLGDFEATAEAKSRALRALTDQWTEPVVQRAAASALCVLASRAEGLRRLGFGRNALREPTLHYLSLREQELLLAILEAADQAGTNQSPVDLNQILTDSSPVARYVQARFPHLWARPRIRDR